MNLFTKSSDQTREIVLGGEESKYMKRSLLLERERERERDARDDYFMISLSLPRE